MGPIYNRLVRAVVPMDYAEMRDLSARSGVPIHTILKIRNGQTADPRISTVQALMDALERRKEKAT